MEILVERGVIFVFVQLELLHYQSDVINHIRCESGVEQRPLHSRDYLPGHGRYRDSPLVSERGSLSECEKPRVFGGNAQWFESAVARANRVRDQEKLVNARMQAFRRAKPWTKGNSPKRAQVRIQFLVLCFGSKS